MKISASRKARGVNRIAILTGILFFNGISARSQEKETDSFEDDLVRAFHLGLAAPKEYPISVNMKIKRSGHTFLFSSRTKKSPDSVSLSCVLCTGEEAITKARSLGAILNARDNGINPAEISAPNPDSSIRITVDGIPVAPAGASHPVEPGLHIVEIHENGAVESARMELDHGEKVELIKTNDHYRQRAKLRSAVALSGPGIGATALGGIFLWLDDQCASTSIDDNGDCAVKHELTALGWGLAAGGIVVATAAWVWFIVSEKKSSPAEKRAK